MARGKTPHRPPRPRDPDLRRLLHNVRVARRNVLRAEGHLIAHRRAEEDAVRNAWAGGASHRELAEATGREWQKGWVHPAMRRGRRGR